MIMTIVEGWNNKPSTEKMCMYMYLIFSTYYDCTSGTK